MKLTTPELDKLIELEKIESEFGPYSWNKRHMHNVSGVTNEYAAHTSAYDSALRKAAAILLQEVKEAREVINFYADETSWTHSDEYLDCDDFLKIDSIDETNRMNYEKDSVGGKRARAHLKKFVD